MAYISLNMEVVTEKISKKIRDIHTKCQISVCKILSLAILCWSQIYSMRYRRYRNLYANCTDSRRVLFHQIRSPHIFYNFNFKLKKEENLKPLAKYQVLLFANLFV